MSEIRATTISDLAGTGPVALTKQVAAKAWVNFNGTGTVAVRDSFNVASTTDYAISKYMVTYTNAMSDGNNSVVAGVNPDNTGTYNQPQVVEIAASYVVVWSSPDRSDSFGDSSVVTEHTMGDLA